MTRTDVTEIPVDERREILEKSQEKKDIDVGGRTIPCILNGATFDFAEQEGIDLDSILQELMMGSTSVKQNLEGAVKLVYASTIPFGTDISIAELKLRVSVERVEEILEELFPDNEDLSEEELEMIQERLGEDSGKGPSSQENGSDGSAMKSARSRGNSSPSKSSS